MSKIEDLVLRLRFDNSKFRDSAAETMTMLDKLKSKMSFKGTKDPFKESVKGAKDLQRAVQEVDLSKLASDVESIKGSFSTLSVVGRTALGKLTVDAMNTGRKIVGAITEPLVGGGMRRALNIEQAEFMLKGLGADVESIMKSANEAVLGTAYSLDEAAKAASQFYASGVSQGEEMTKALLGISGVAAMTSSEYGQIADIFTTVAGQGKLMSQQLNQFASRGLNVAATLAKYYKVSEAEVREMVSKGKVTFEDFAKSMSEAYGEHATKAGETFQGAIANAKAPLARIGADVASVYLKQMTGLFNALKPFLDVVHGALEPVIEFINMMQTRSIQGVTRFFESLTKGLDKKGDLGWIGDIGKGIGNLLEQMDRLRDSVSRAFVRQWTEMGEGVRSVVDKIASAFLRFTESVKFSDIFLYNNARIFGTLFAIIDTGLTVVKSFVASLAAIGDAILRHVVPHLMTFVRYIARTISWILRFIKGGQAIEGAFGGVTAVIIGAIKAFGWLLEKITSVTDAIFGFMHSIAVKLLGGTIFDPSIYPEKQAKAFVEKLKNIGSALKGIPTKGLELLKGSFSVLITLAKEFGKTLVSLVKMVDFSWFTNAVGGVTKQLGRLKGIKNPFGKMRGPDLDFKGANAKIEGFGESLRKAIRQGERLPWERVTDPIKRAFKGVSDYVGRIEWSEVFSAMGNGIKSGAATIKDMFATLFSNTKELFSGVDWAEAGRTVVEKLAKGFTAAKNITVSLAKGLTEAITSAIEAIDFGAIWDNVKDFGKGLKEGLFGSKDEVEEALDSALPDKKTVDVEIDTTSVETSLENATVGGKVQSTLKQFGEAIREFFRGVFSDAEDEIESGAGGVGATVKKALSKVWDVFSSIGENFTTITGWITNPIKNFIALAKSAIGEGTSDLEVAIGNLGDKIQDKFSKIDLVELLNAAGFFAIGAGILRLSGTLKKITDSFAGIGKAVQDTLGQVGKSIEDFGKAAKTTARGNFILKLAVSVGLLAVAMKILATLSWEEVAKGLVSVAVAIGILTAAAMFGGKGGGAFGGVPMGIGAIAVSLLLLYAAIRLFDAIDTEVLVKGLLKVTAVLVGLALFGTLMSAASKKWGSATDSIKDLAKGMLLLSAALLIMAATIWVFKFIDLESWGKAMGTIAIVAGSLVALSAASKMWEAPIKDLANTFLIVAVSLVILGFAITQLGEIAIKDFAVTVGVIVGMFALLAGASKLLDTGEMLKAAVALTAAGLGVLMFAGAVMILAIAVKFLSDLNFGELMTGLVGLTVTVGVLAGAMIALSKWSDDMKEVSKSLFILVAAIALLAGIVWLFKDSSFEDIGPGLAVLLAATVALIGLSAALNQFDPDPKAAASMIAMSAALVVFAYAIKMLEDVDTETIVAATASLSVGILGLAIALQILDGVKGALSSAGAILIMAAAIVVLAFAFQMLDDVDPVTLAVNLGLMAASLALLLVAAGFAEAAAPGLMALAAAIAIVALAVSGAVWIISDASQKFMDAFERFGPALEKAGEAIKKFEDTGLESLKNIMNELSIGDAFTGFVNGMAMGKLAKELGKFGNEDVTRASEAMKNFGDGIGPFKDGISDLANLDTGALNKVGENLKKAFSGDLADGIRAAANDISRAVDAIANTIKGKGAAFQGAGRELGDKFRVGIRDKTPDAQNEGRFLAIRGAEAAKEQRGNWVEAGRQVGAGMAEGIRASTGEAVAAAKAMAQAVTAAAKVDLKIKSPSRVFRGIGKFVSVGMAEGIRGSAHLSAKESANMANGLVKTAEKVLEIKSPSRRFRRVGQEVNNGLAKGIKDSSPKPKKAMAKNLDGVIGVYKEKGDAAKAAGDEFVDNLFYAFTTTDHYRKIDSLVKHAKAQRATAIKEKKIADAEERERKEDERDQIYRDVRESKKELAEAKKAKSEIGKENAQANNAKNAAADADKNYAEANEKIRDAEKKHRRALSKKERYEYQQYGSEAGVAFKDGVAEGLIDDSDRIPTFAEYLSEVLLEEFEEVKKQANDFIGVFDGLQKVFGNFRQMRDHTNELRRAFTRLSHSSNPRAFRRNLGDVFEASLSIGKEIVGLLDIVDKLKPFVPMLITQIQGALPALSAAIAPIAPGLAASLGSGLTTGLAAITGPVGAAALGVIGAIALIFDSGNEDDQIVLKFLKSIQEGIVTFLENLPDFLIRTARQFFSGIKNIVVEVPRMIVNLIKGVLFGVIKLIKASPTILVEVVRAIVDMFVSIITETPEIFAELIIALIEAIILLFTDAIPALIVALPGMFKDIGEAILYGIIEGFKGGFHSVKDAFTSFGERTKEHFKRIFRIKSPSRVFMEMGRFLTEGIAVGVSDGEADVGRSMDGVVRALFDSVEDLETNPDLSLHITPVIDMDEMDRELRRISALNTNVTADAANSVLSREGGFGNVANNVTNITYTQNNTSPKPLSTIELYRNTERQLRMLQ